MAGETVGEVRAKLPSMLGVPSRSRVRLFNPATKSEFADDAATAESAGLGTPKYVFVSVTGPTAHKKRARSESAHVASLLFSEVERLRAENAALRSEMETAGVPATAPGASLLPPGFSLDAARDGDAGADEDAAPCLDGLPDSVDVNVAGADAGADAGDTMAFAQPMAFAIDVGGATTAADDSFAVSFGGDAAADSAPFAVSLGNTVSAAQAPDDTAPMAFGGGSSDFAISF